MELWLTQAWLVASGLISLFLDPKNRKAWWAKPTLVLFIIIPASLAIAFGQQKAENAKQQALQAKEQHRKDQLQILALQRELQSVGKGVGRAVEGLQTLLIGFGFTPETAAIASPERISKSKEANSLIQAAVSSSTASIKSERRRIVVQYFPKNVDPDAIEKTLSALGFTFMTGVPQQQGATNAIWFGTDVPLSDVKLVALTLVRAGVDLKTIKPFRRSHPVPDRNLLIQVGTDGDFSEQPSLTINQISNAPGFFRPD
jgi:hypothetical protein